MSDLNKAFLLAAGQGTRLQPFTNKCPKPAIPFWGLPQFLYSYFFLKDLGLTDFAFNSHHLSQVLNKEVLEKYNIHATEFYEPQLLNSAGGIANAGDFLKTSHDFFVMNADTLFIYQNLKGFKTAIQKHSNEQRLATLFAVEKTGVGESFPGLWYQSDNSQLISAGLKSSEKIGLKCAHFVGVYIFSKQIFSYINLKPTNIIYDHLLDLSQQGKSVHVEVVKNLDCFELGKIQDFQKAHQEITHKLQDQKNIATSSFLRAQKYFNKNWNFEQFQPQGIERDILNYKRTPS